MIRNETTRKKAKPQAEMRASGTVKQGRRPMFKRHEKITHTPGPWQGGRSLSGRDVIALANGEVICTVHYHSERSAMNARLIGGAPDLLAERKEISAKLGVLEWSCPEHAEILLKQIIEKFYDSAAVVKAEGV